MREQLRGLLPARDTRSLPPVCPCTFLPQLQSRARIPAADGPLDLEPGKADSPGTGVATVK